MAYAAGVDVGSTQTKAVVVDENGDIVGRSLLPTGANVVQSPMRGMMFMITFVAIGVITDFSKLKGMGRLTVLYAVALFGIIAPIAYAVAWLFHHGMMPPIAK